VIGRLEAITLILQSASNGATKTSLMYECYLSFEALQEYITSLLDTKLLEYHPGEMTFNTTAAGREFLSANLEANSLNKCDHQCMKCGCLYYCDRAPKCDFPYLHGICKGCAHFLIGRNIRSERRQEQSMSVE
jgi:predicted transcriptional regulator